MATYGNHRTQSGLEWARANGVNLTKDEKYAILYKVTRADGLSNQSYYAKSGQSLNNKKMIEPYTPGKSLTAPDFDSSRHCGAGLHLSPKVSQARGYHGSSGAAFSCLVAVADIVPLGSDKCKVKSLTVIQKLSKDEQSTSTKRQLVTGDKLTSRNSSWNKATVTGVSGTQITVRSQYGKTATRTARDWAKSYIW